ncbi:MAG: rRNA maturation RNase YbeY [Candidatus Omnitrophota bacterium]
MKIAEAVLRKLKRNNAEIDLIFLSSQKIRALNRVYFDSDTATDVIAFPSGGEAGEAFHAAARRAGGRFFLGEITISSDRAAVNARVYGTSFMEEITLYVIHGILHLLGYEDITEEGRKRMRRKENEFLQEAGRYP